MKYSFTKGASVAIICCVPIVANSLTYFDCANSDGSMAYRIEPCLAGQIEKRHFDVDEKKSDSGNKESVWNVSPRIESPKIIREQSGNISNYRAKGNLASTQAVGCITLTEAKNTFTPADLYRSVGECIANNDYHRATGLFMLAGIYASFDAERITDKTAAQARTVLIMNLFSTMPLDKKNRFNEAAKRTVSNSESLNVLCGEIQKIGMPNYYPNYMILHGMKAFTGNPHDGAIDNSFNASGTWKKLQSTYLNCPNLSSSDAGR